MAGTKVSERTKAATSAMITVRRHRLEHLAFDAGEGQQRHVDSDDDDLAEHRRLDHLLAGDQHLLQPFRERQQPLPSGAGARRAGAARSR